MPVCGTAATFTALPPAPISKWASIDLSSDSLRPETCAALGKMSEHPDYSAVPEVDAMDFV
eukprot:175684-Rhodomonas_salina.1